MALDTAVMTLVTDPQVTVRRRTRTISARLSGVIAATIVRSYSVPVKKTKIFIKVQGDISEPNHLRCAKELTAPTDPRQRQVSYLTFRKRLF